MEVVGLLLCCVVVQIPHRVNVRTIQRLLNKLGMVNIRPCKKPLLSVVNRRKRLACAREHRDYNWDRVIFSDEKVFRVRPGNTVRYSLHFTFTHRNGELVSLCSLTHVASCVLRCWKLATASKLVGKYTMPTVQKAESVMVWAAMKRSGEICLRRCPVKVNAVAYQGILDSARAFIQPRCATRGSCS